MEGELTVRHDELMNLAGEKGLDTLLKPLVNEIHLFDTHIAGTTHLKDKTVLEKIGVGEKLTLRREENKFDAKAILVLDGSGNKLGYIPEADNLIFSRLLDAGKMLSAKISKITVKGTFKSIAIGIYLMDF